MFKYLIGFSLRNAAPVLLVGLLLVIVAAWQLPRLPVDVFPELNAPTVLVMGEAGGLAADEVEQYVTFPIETAVNGLPGVRRVRSASAISLSMVWVEFDWGADIYRARQLVGERLAEAKDRIPDGVHVEIGPMTSITGEIMLLAVSSPDESVPPLDLRAFAEFDLRNRILAVPGISQVVTIGGELPEYQVHVRQEDLLLYGLTIGDVVDAARESHSTASAGYLPNVEHREIPIRQAARVRSVDDIAATIIRTRDGAPITIGRVADVALGGAPKRGTAADAGRPSVVLSVQKAPGANTLLLTQAVDRVLDQADAGLPPGIRINRAVFRQTDFINRSMRNVTTVLRDATIIVAVILVLFLLNVRTTIITLTALPLSLAAALLAMWGLGLTVNVMTLGGLAIAIGVLVDDAIIDVENVFRRLRENAARPADARRPVLDVVYDASNEIRRAMVFATVIIAIVFVPLLFLGGMEGRFFRPLGITYIVSIMASLLVALTVTPAMCRYLLAGRLGRHDGRDGFLVRWLKRRYEPTLRLALRFRRTVLGLAAAGTALTIWLGSTFGSSFLPEFNEGTFTVFLMAPPGTSLVESDRLARGVEQRLVELPGVRSVTRRTGRAERDEHAEPVSSSEIEVTVLPGFEKAVVRDGIDRILHDVPGITTMIGQPIEHRLSHILSGTPAAIAISVFGDDLAVLRRLAQEIEAGLQGLPGTRDVAANREVLVTTLPIRYRAADLAASGLTPAMAAAQVQIAIAGETAARVNQGVRQYDIVVRLDPAERDRIERVSGLLLRGRDGARVRLGDVADIGPELASNLIARENAQRKAVISCNIAPGYNLGHVAREVQARVDPIVHRAGCTVAYGGQFEAQQSASRTIGIMGAGVLLIMLLLLQVATGSFRAALLVMFNLPLAMIGGIVAILLTEPAHPFANMFALFGIGGGRFEAPVVSIASLVGFVTLFGIAIRNGVLLVNHYGGLMERDGLPLDRAILQGSMERLSPILMTALSAALGLVPLALAAGEPGSELLAPLAIVVLGGLITSTFLNLVVVPAGCMLILSDRRVPVRASHARPNGAASETHA
ncbi:MAG: efflux RND transporter permease subunit [Phycisphaeraceae bacterium]|nr:efflux RND transporter permease subunit [Phycisphaeraceae bacterium]